MYNRASADKDGRPWDRERVGIEWNGTKWIGDVPDIDPTSKPGQYGAFIMNAEGVGRLFAPGMEDGPFPEHYEAYESPVDNLLHEKVRSNPVAKRFDSDKDVFGSRDEFPVQCTTYRLTEKYHYWTQHNDRLDMLQPDFFFEIPEALARERGIANNERIKVSSARGSLVGKALVTKRIVPFEVDGKRVWQIGFPIHWGFAGPRPGPLANFLTAAVLEPNVWTPEYKTFAVRIDKLGGAT
jgi:formate dehydrogenase major subunit